MTEVVSKFNMSQVKLSVPLTFIFTFTINTNRKCDKVIPPVIVDMSLGKALDFAYLT